MIQIQIAMKKVLHLMMLGETSWVNSTRANACKHNKMNESLACVYTFGCLCDAQDEIDLVTCEKYKATLDCELVDYSL